MTTVLVLALALVLVLLLLVIAEAAYADLARENRALRRENARLRQHPTAGPMRLFAGDEYGPLGNGGGAA